MEGDNHAHDCGITPEENEAAMKLGLEINQAVNRVISKLGGEMHHASLLMPLAHNVAHVMFTVESAGREPFALQLETFTRAVAICYERIVTEQSKG